MKTPLFLLLLTALWIQRPACVRGADLGPGIPLESRGLPTLLYNNDSDDLKWPAYPEHHAGLWVPAGNPVPISPIHSLEEYLALRIGPLADTPVQGLSYCGNFGVPIWEMNRTQIAALGEDPLQPILQFWKQKGRKFFFSMRMNDKHHAWFNWSHLWDEFRQTHRHWFLHPPTEQEWTSQFLPWIQNPAKPGPGEMWARVSNKPALIAKNSEAVLYDYSRSEVRNHYLDLFREACRRYDLDGIEMDWLRFPKFFREGEVSTAVLTEFVREVRGILDSAAQKRGHALRLVARVPDTPARAKELGLDVEAWLKAGFLDAVIAGNGFTFSSNSLDQWVSLAHPHGVPVYGVIERSPRGFSRFGSPETVRAAAATLWARGADGIYTFNFYNNSEYPLLAELENPTKLARLPKEFFVDACSEHNMRTVSGIDLPLDLSPSSPGSVDLFISDDPAMAKEAGLEIVFSGQNGTEPPALSVNGLPLHGLKSVPANSGSAFILSSKELREALKKGANRFELKSQTQTKLSSLSVRIEP